MALSEGMIACRWGISKWACMLLLAIVSGCTVQKENIPETLPFYNTAAFDAEWIEPTDSAYKFIHQIPSFSFTDQSGKAYGSDSLKGNIYLANFFFTRCAGICPKMTNNFLLLQDSLRSIPDIRLVSFSVTPWSDSVSVLRNYAAEHHIDKDKWHLLTGDKETIYTLARQSFFAEKTLGQQKGTDEFLHTESTLLIDKKGRIRGIYNATQRTDMDRIMDDLHTLLAEK